METSEFAVELRKIEEKDNVMENHVSNPRSCLSFAQVLHNRCS